VPPQNPRARGRRDRAVAADRRFVQVLLLVMGDMLLGRRLYWPLYAAAQKHGLTIGIHAGGTYRYAPTGSGWPAHKVEDYIAQSAAFEGQLLSLISEGVFQKFRT
jgi:predicted TIM-barrel fold metal-dependent hydrolase